MSDCSSIDQNHDNTEIFLYVKVYNKTTHYESRDIFYVASFVPEMI